MSVHKMSQAGLIVILDGRDSYFQEKVTGKKTKLKYEGGRYYFDIWTEAPKHEESKVDHQIGHKIRNSEPSDMEVDAVKRSNRFWILGTDEGNSDFLRQD